MNESSHSFRLTDDCERPFEKANGTVANGPDDNLPRCMMIDVELAELLSQKCS
ncbi:DUF7386 family protein [Halorubrum lipolyticum]